MTLSTFDADGHRQPPKPSRDWWVPAFVCGLLLASAGGSWLIAWVLDAGLSPGRVVAWLAGLLSLAILFGLREYGWRVERAERIAYEAELRGAMNDAELRLASHRAAYYRPCSKCGRDAA